MFDFANIRYWDVEEWILNVFMALCILFLAGVILFLTDYFCGVTQPVVGIVVGRSYTPGHTSIISNGKTTSVQYYPPTWHLQVQGPHGLASAATSEYGYNTIPDSTAFQYTETTGWLSGTIYSN